ncbi:MAG: Crp/Fnr family transcriptional regulator, partial [Alphaproteobacteria bacterium]|nr:Crp/Fnr family transcriptional regulator [Alphaproteobacteria bacterium]
YRPLLAKQDHHATAEILKEANICFLDAVTARTFIYNNHELGLRFLEQTARALGETEERLYEVAVLDVHVRLIHLLLLFRDNWGQTLEDGSVSIVLPVTREEIASMVGARPESIYRAIRRLESDGLALFKGRQVHIEHFELLAEELQINLQTVQ